MSTHRLKPLSHISKWLRAIDTSTLRPIYDSRHLREALRSAAFHALRTGRSYCIIDKAGRYIVLPHRVQRNMLIVTADLTVFGAIDNLV